MSPTPSSSRRAAPWIIAVALSCGGKAVIDAPATGGAGGASSSSSGVGAGTSSGAYGGHANAVTAGCMDFIAALNAGVTPCDIPSGNAVCHTEAEQISAYTGPCGAANDCVAKQCKCIPPDCSGATCACVVSCLETHHPPAYCFDQFDAYYGCMAHYCSG